MKRLEYKYNVVVAYNDCLDGKGYYIPAYRMIVVNSRFSEQEQFEVILHELGHARQSDYSGLYNCTKAAHSKMEAEAVSFMLGEEVKEYLSENSLESSSVNPIDFLENRHLSLRYAPIVEKILSEI